MIACVSRFDRTLAFAERALRPNPAQEENARLAASALYHIASCILTDLGRLVQNWIRAGRCMARLVLEHRLSARDPLEPEVGEWEREAAEFLFSEREVSMSEIAGLLN